MEDDNIDIDDIESFIDGLKTSFDTLEEVNMEQGFQMQLAKAISALRAKKIAKITPIPKDIRPRDMKKVLLYELEVLKNLLDSGNYPRSKKFRVVMEIAKLRETISNL
jgi:hypothetical protein